MRPGIHKTSQMFMGRSRLVGLDGHLRSGREDVGRSPRGGTRRRRSRQSCRPLQRRGAILRSLECVPPPRRTDRGGHARRRGRHVPEPRMGIRCADRRKPCEPDGPSPDVRGAYRRRRRPRRCVGAKVYSAPGGSRGGGAGPSLDCANTSRGPGVPRERRIDRPGNPAPRGRATGRAPGPRCIPAIRPAPDWLRQLVQPLADSTVGVATGFRWYLPPRPTFWSLVRAEWNAVSANVLFDPRRSFAWGGSCAIRKDLLVPLRLEDRWHDVLSDDLILTQAVREAGLKIAYVPAALVPTFEGADRATCIEWCFRQMTMATLYLPIVRRYATAAFAVFNGSILFGIACFALAGIWGVAYLIPAAIFLAPLPVSIAKASLRRRALFSAAPTVAAAWNVPAWRTAIAAIAIPWVMTAGLLRTRRPTTIRWRGHTYDVSDPQHVPLLDGAIG